MGRIRGYFKELGSKKESIVEAIKYCDRHGILREYLEIHGKEAPRSCTALSGVGAQINMAWRTEILV